MIMSFIHLSNLFSSCSFLWIGITHTPTIYQSRTIKFKTIPCFMDSYWSIHIWVWTNFSVRLTTDWAELIELSWGLISNVRESFVLVQPNRKFFCSNKKKTIEISSLNRIMADGLSNTSLCIWQPTAFY